MARLVFPYRVVLQHEDGRSEVFEDEMGFVLGEGMGVTFRRGDATPRYWVVERVEFEREDHVPTEPELEADPSIRCGTAYLRPRPKPGERD